MLYFFVAATGYSKRSTNSCDKSFCLIGRNIVADIAESHALLDLFAVNCSKAEGKAKRCGDWVDIGHIVSLLSCLITIIVHDKVKKYNLKKTIL